MNKISIEEINGKKCTVIRKDFDAEWVKEQLSMGNAVLAETWGLTNFMVVGLKDDMYMSIDKSYETIFDAEEVSHDRFKHTITILPALPRHPKPEDAPLLCRYMAEGLELYFSWDTSKGIIWRVGGFSIDQVINHNSEITHATLNGERVEIAIIGEEDDDNKCNIGDLVWLDLHKRRQGTEDDDFEPHCVRVTSENQFTKNARITVLSPSDQRYKDWVKIEELIKDFNNE